MLKAFKNDPVLKIEHIKNLTVNKVIHRINGEPINDWFNKNIKDIENQERQLGIPEWLLRVRKFIYENLEEKYSQIWLEEFLNSINPGADLNKIEAPFNIFVLQSNYENFDHNKFPDVKKSIDTIIGLYEIGDLEPSEKWSAAESAAWSAAYAAESAAESAADAAAWSAAWSAARSAVYEKFAKKLIELLKECKC